MNKFKISLVVIVSVVALLVGIAYSGLFYGYRLERLQQQSIEKIIEKSAPMLIDRYFQNLTAEEDRASLMSVTSLRHDWLEEEIAPRVPRSAKADYERLAYAAFTYSEPYHWSYYSQGASEELFWLMSGAYNFLLEGAKEYFSNPENLEKIYSQNKHQILEKIWQLPIDKRALLLNELIKIANMDINDVQIKENHPDNHRTLFMYNEKFFLRRQAEGGDELILTYKWMANDMANKVVNRSSMAFAGELIKKVRQKK